MISPAPRPARGHVMENGDSEYEEEEVVVLAELNGLVDDELLTKGCTYQFVGIDTDKPVLQLGKYNFLGSYEDQIGSALFLRQSTDDEDRTTWSKLCFSDKKLSMQRVFLRKKGEGLPVAPVTMERDVAMDEGSTETLEAEAEAGRETGGGLELDPSNAAKERQPEPNASAESATAVPSSAVVPDEVSPDVDMPPAEGTDAAPSKAPASNDDPPSVSEPSAL